MVYSVLTTGGTSSIRGDIKNIFLVVVYSLYVGAHFRFSRGYGYQKPRTIGFLVQFKHWCCHRLPSGGAGPKPLIAVF